MFLKNNMYFCRKLTNPKLKYKYEKNVFCTYVGNYDLSNLDNVGSLGIEVTNYPIGSYTVVLVCDNAVCHSKVLIRQ